MGDEHDISLRLSGDLYARLKRIAELSGESEAELATAAVVDFVAHEEAERRLIERRLAKARGGGPFLEHDEVDRWLGAVGTANATVRPKVGNRGE